MDAQLCHIIASGMFNGIFEIVVHDMPKEQAMHYVDQLRDFYTAGWLKLIGSNIPPIFFGRSGLRPFLFTQSVS